MHFMMILLTNIIDFGIIHLYLQCFSSKKEQRKFLTLTMSLLYSLALTLINSMQIPLINLLGSCALIYLYSVFFVYPFAYRVTLPIFYLGLAIILEPVGLIFIRTIDGYFPSVPLSITYYAAMLFAELVRLIIVLLISIYWNSSLPQLPLRKLLLPSLIPITGIISCCIVVNIVLHTKNPELNLLCITIILMALFSNLLAFIVLKKLSFLLSEKYKNEKVLQDAALKEIYYREVDNNNRQVRRIRHDLKNRLTGICAIEDGNPLISVKIQEILGELDKSEAKIYTSNCTLNSVLQVKYQESINKGIKIKNDVLVPKYMNIDYGDMGVLFGNLLDNAIEACMNIPVEKRFIHLSANYVNCHLVLKMTNSKTPLKRTGTKSYKNDTINHGFGLRSVHQIVKKYNGTTEFLDHGETFESSAILYGISDKKD